MPFLWSVVFGLIGRIPPPHCCHSIRYFLVTFRQIRPTFHIAIFDRTPAPALWRYSILVFYFPSGYTYVRRIPNRCNLYGVPIVSRLVIIVHWPGKTTASTRRRLHSRSLGRLRGGPESFTRRASGFFIFLLRCMSQAWNYRKPALQMFSR